MRQESRLRKRGIVSPLAIRSCPIHKECGQINGIGQANTMKAICMYRGFFPKPDWMVFAPQCLLKLSSSSQDRGWKKRMPPLARSIRVKYGTVTVPGPCGHPEDGQGRLLSDPPGHLDRRLLVLLSHLQTRLPAKLPLLHRLARLRYRRHLHLHHPSPAGNS